jgi:hypothetical protein
VNLLNTATVLTPTPLNLSSSGPVKAPGELIDIDHPRRIEAEQFIAQRFFDNHGARISVFMSILMVHFDADDQICAALGIRSATDGPLFLEYYLDMPVEQAISWDADSRQPDLKREQIVEIGNLASTDRTASRWLFYRLAHQLASWNFECVVFTGGTSLNRMFARMGIETVCLARALQSRLPGDQQTWGGYYEDDPRVMSGRVSSGTTLVSELGSRL